MPNRTITRGDTKTWDLVFTTPGGDDYPLTGCTVWFTAKRYAGDNDDDAVVLHFWNEDDEDGISLVDPETGTPSVTDNGVLYHRIDPLLSSTLHRSRYPFDVQFQTEDGEIVTLEQGDLVVTGDITNRVITP